ncbi:hypothetical protein ACT2FY_13110 [Paraburkholderia fungorum]|uniref:hypothetical protein n=1 Tax=Paraburkholderia fungorum TaxID=134537 RepID=UPI00402B0CFE
MEAIVTHSGRKAVVVTIGEICIAGIPAGAVNTVPAEKRAAAVREPVAGAIAPRLAGVAPIHPPIDAVVTLAAHRASGQAGVMPWVPTQASACRAVAATDVAT